MLKNYFLSITFLLVGISSKAQTVLEYNVSAAATAVQYQINGLNLEFTAITTCQTDVSVVLGSSGYNGSWSNGSYNYYVNGTLAGTGSGSTTVNLSAFIPVQSIRIEKSNQDNWNTVSIQLSVTSNSAAIPLLPQAISDVYFLQNSTAAPLTALLTGTGSALKWYTSAVGDNYSAIAPTPNTSALGITSYWVSQADATGCESIRKQINVHTVLPATHLDFDGMDDYVNCGNLPALQISGNAITLEARVKFNSFAFGVSDGNIINKEQNSPDYGYMLRAGASGIVNFNLGNSLWNELDTPENTVTTNVWYHLAAVYDGNYMKIFVDGQEVASQAVSNIEFSSPNQNLMIGSWSTVGRFLNGSIEEVRVWNVARSQVQLQDNRNCELDNPTSQTGLVAYYQFNQGLADGENISITTLSDASATASTGILNNFALNGLNSNWLSGSTVVTGSSCSSLASGDFASNSLAVKVYPNPSLGVFQIETQEEVTMEVYNILSNQILNKKVQEGNTLLDISGYASGIYLLKLTTNAGTINTYKLIKN